jgi:hypothetical protein
MNTDIRPEFLSFCRLLHRPQRLEEVQELHRTISNVTDWTAVIRGAERHRVAPLVLANLKGCPSPQVPDDVMSELRRLSIEAARRSLAQVAELGRLSLLFENAGICILVLKGVVLSSQLYGEIAWRGARDIDLLVDPAQFERAAALLTQSGYRQLFKPQSPRQIGAHRNIVKDLEYHHPATNTLLELHDRLTDNPNLLASNFSVLWNEREKIRIGDRTLPTLPRRRLPLYLCVHGSVHAWERLRWLVDFIAALAQPGSAAEALEAADAVGLSAMMQHALLLAHDWLGLSIEENDLASARNSPQVKRLHRLLCRLYAGEAWHTTPRRDSWEGMMRYSVWMRLHRLCLNTDRRLWSNEWARAWISPSDWETVPLPDRLFWLYPFLRPAAWLIRRWKR